MMNILEQEDIIKGLPDQALMQEAQMPSGQVPQYLVVSEIQRRSDMRKRYKAEQGQMPQATVKEQVMQEGIMSMMPQMPPQMAMAPQMPQRMPQMPPPSMMSEGGQATLRDKYYNLDTEDVRGEGFYLDADDNPTANRRGILQGLSLLGVDQETIDNATRRTAEPPKGLVDLIENLIRAGKTRGFIDEDFAPGIKVEKKANGGFLDSTTVGGALVKDQLDALINSEQMGYADILSFLDSMSLSNEDRMAAIDYVKGKTGTLERAGYAFDQFGDRLGSAFNRLTGRTEANAAQDAQLLENLQAGNLKRLSTEEELRAGAPEEIPVGVTEGALPMPGFGGLAGLLGRQGGKQLATRYNPINVPNLSSARPVVLGGAEAVSSLVEGDEEAIGPLEALAGQIPPYEQARQNVSDYFADRFSGVGDFYSGLSDIYNAGLAGLASAVVPGGQVIPEEPTVVEAEPEPETIDDIISGGGIEKKGGGEEVQSTSADRMAELLERMGRANRGAALVALGSGIAEGKTMEGGREAANILAKGEQAATKLEVDATQFNRQMDLLEQRVDNAAKSGNASVIAALVTSLSKQLEALDTLGMSTQPGVPERIEALRGKLNLLMNAYLPASGAGVGTPSPAGFKIVARG